MDADPQPRAWQPLASGKAGRGAAGPAGRGGSRGRGFRGEEAGAAAVLGEGVARGPVAIFWAPRQSPTWGAGRAAGGPLGAAGRPAAPARAGSDGRPGGARGQGAVAA